MPRTGTPPKVPDPIPENLTWYGITPIGVLDLGGAYQTNGRPLGSVVSGLEYSPFTTTRNYTGQSITTFNIAPFSNHLSA